MLYPEKYYSVSNTSCFSKPNSHSDVVLLVEGKRVYCNKTILSCASPVFEKMFHGDFIEKNQNEISLPGKKREDFISFLECIHPTTLAEITIENVGAVLPLAEEYQVVQLKKRCDTFLQRRIIELDRKHGKNFQSSFQDRFNDQINAIVYVLQLADHYNLVQTCEEAINKMVLYHWTSLEPFAEKANISDKTKFRILSTRMIAAESKEISYHQKIYAW